MLSTKRSVGMRQRSTQGTLKIKKNLNIITIPDKLWAERSRYEEISLDLSQP
jgi:hypothetical protein